jgi:hypothetical protein
MPYVKISDPQVIDLAAWHQVINVVNQHSDSISSITNNLGGSLPEAIDFNGESDFVNSFDPGAQKILYGRTKLSIGDLSPVDATNHIYYGNIDFAENGQSSFGARPIITASIQFGHTSIGDLENKNYDIIFIVFAVTKERFSFRVNRAIAEQNETNQVKQ